MSEPTLAHVATTLQFCLEQLELCGQVVDKDLYLPPVADFIEDARQATFAALSYLRVAGIVPAPIESEGIVVA